MRWLTILTSISVGLVAGCGSSHPARRVDSAATSTSDSVVLLAPISDSAPPATPDSSLTPDTAVPDTAPVCTPDCAGRQCGPDGCGGSCGSCQGSTYCDGNGQCQCQPVCGGGQCGPDGCGGSCGTCTPPTTCDVTTKMCVGAPAPNSGKVCSGSQPCSGGDICVQMEQGALKGICLAPCGTPGDPCPAAAGQLSACAGVVSGQNVCLYLCQLDGKSYACPDPVGFVCKVQAAVPQASLCVPAP